MLAEIGRFLHDADPDDEAGPFGQLSFSRPTTTQADGSSKPCLNPYGMDFSTVSEGRLHKSPYLLMAEFSLVDDGVSSPL